MPVDDVPDPRFLADRMLGTLARYLRFMGYDTLTIHHLASGNRQEDSLLLVMARDDDRILLTRDRDLARRGGSRVILIRSVGVLDQVAELRQLGLIIPLVRMTRCSLCNALLIPAPDAAIATADYAPSEREGRDFSWCPGCRRLYWAGSHGADLERRLTHALHGEGEHEHIP